MKKKLLLVLLAIICIITYLSINTFAADYSGFIASGGSNNVTDLTYQNALEAAKKMLPDVNFDNYNLFYYKTDIGGRYGVKIYFIPKSSVMVRVKVDDDFYRYFPYELDDNKKLVNHLIGYYATVEVGYTSVSKGTLNFVGVNINAEGYSHEYNGPFATNTDDAYQYLITGDASYLYNSELFYDVPEPENVSMYLASEENSAYIYWENSNGFFTDENSVTDGTKKTRIEVNYWYRDSEQNIKYIQVPIIEFLDYSKRYQYFVSLEPLINYDTGNIEVKIYNTWNIGSSEREVWINSDTVEVDYHINSDYYTAGVVGGDYLKTSAILDYGLKNDSYTGGRVDLDTLPSVSSGDYNFFNWLFTGFGLLGDSGLISMIGGLFSYLPDELIILLLGGIGSLIAVAIFKMFIKS